MALPARFKSFDFLLSEPRRLRLINNITLCGLRKSAMNKRPGICLDYLSNLALENGTQSLPPSS